MYKVTIFLGENMYHGEYYWKRNSEESSARISYSYCVLKSSSSRRRHKWLYPNITTGQATILLCEMKPVSIVGQSETADRDRSCLSLRNEEGL
ncbi:hypothetical protein AVEN_269411-1 [Araneus ventricosus]|uniref:Uncharacterized protein n=1 Tax=Araneus ventricosus TaxID=182803 RepID=A0A4Y2R569_ARAVE|nr:hypothetical protein AVEN_269411-1 [Araneus ventricosus]